MAAVEGNENWYSVTFQIKDAAANDGFTIYQNDSNNTKAEYDNQWNNTQQYAAFVSGAKSGYAIKDGTVYEDLAEAGLTIKDQDQPETSGSEVTKDGYTLKLTADQTEVTVGDTVTFTASLQKGGQEIKDLTEAGYHIYWWNNTTNSQSEFVDYVSDGAEGARALTMKMQPQQVGVSPSGVALFADQSAAATGWINFAYQGSYIIIGLMFFFIFCFVFRLEYQMPQVSKELHDRKIADCAKLGIEYIPANVLQKREIEEQEREAEEIRIKELKEKCQKKGLNFEVENKKILDKREAKRVKAEKKAAKKNK